MATRILLGLLTIIAFAGTSMSLGHAQNHRRRTECDRLTSVLEEKAPAEAYEAFQNMRVYRQSGRHALMRARPYRPAPSRREVRPTSLSAGTDVLNEEGEQVANGDRLRQGTDQRIYVLMTYRGPCWPGNKQVAVPLERTMLDGSRLLPPEIREQNPLAITAVRADGGLY